MKTTSLGHLLFNCALAVVLVAAALPVPVQAQDAGGFFTVGGTVRDAASRRPVAGVEVTVSGTDVGTVSNGDGSFSIKIKRGAGERELEFSHLGYNLRRLPVAEGDLAGVTVELFRGTIVLPEVIVVNREARAIVDEAVRRIGSNYSDRTERLTGFYRETIRKRNSYIDVAEAVVDIQRDSYAVDVRGDRLRIVKGRRLVSQRPSDTLAVKIQGGPVGYLMTDIVLDREMLLDNEELDLYRFSLETPVSIGDRAHYTVAFEPAVAIPDRALFRGRLYIDHESLTISRGEFALDMSSPDKVTNMILRRKPASLRFRPHEASFVLDYRRQGGRSYLYYIGTRIRFGCDWRRRLFATNYTTFAETVITDRRDGDVSPITIRESFRPHQSLADRVGDFHDPEFWEDYNIIEPTESLENAVERLKRRSE